MHQNIKYKDIYQIISKIFKTLRNITIA